MNTIRKATAAMVACIATITPAFAATGTREDHSGILVWAFLGLCALIVVAQVVPAVLMMIGMVKGFVRTRHPARETVFK